MPGRPLVSVVDDDESVRESLPDLLRELGFAVEAFSSADLLHGPIGAARHRLRSTARARRRHATVLASRRRR